MAPYNQLADYPGSGTSFLEQHDSTRFRSGYLAISRSRLPIDAFLGRYATKDNLVHSAGRRVYKDAHPGRQDVNTLGSNGWSSQ